MKHISVRMDDETYRRLEEQAKALKLPKSWIIRRAVEYYLDKLSRKDRLELTLSLAEEVEPTEEEKRILGEYENKPLEGVPHEEARRMLGL